MSDYEWTMYVLEGWRWCWSLATLIRMLLATSSYSSLCCQMPLLFSACPRHYKSDDSLHENLKALLGLDGQCSRVSERPCLKNKVGSYYKTFSDTSAVQ